MNDERPAVQFSFRGLALALVILGVCFAAIGWFYRGFVRPSQHTRAIERHIHSLAMRRPADMSPLQWESAVAWTLNLHANSLMRFQADANAIGRLEQDLARRLDDDVDMETIHWIWDQYAAVCRGGESYQRFRPQMLEEIERGGGNWGLDVP